MSPRLVPAAVLALLGLAVPAAAADYPYSGFFTVAADPERPGSTDPAHCAVNFFRQNIDGTFIGYHVDLERFKADKSVRYVVYNRGTCTYDAADHTESCFTAFDTDTVANGQTFVDVLVSRDDRFIRTISFEDRQAAQTYHATGEKGGGFPIGFYRCRFDETAIAAALTEDISPLGVEARFELMDNANPILGAPLVAELMQRLGLENKE